MSKPRNNYWLAPVLVIAGVVLVGMAFLLGFVNPVEAAIQLPPEQGPDNTDCLSCHQNPDQTMLFPSREELSITILPAIYGGSAHKNLACQSCHTDISGYPHPENNVELYRYYALQYQDTCKNCHPNQYVEIQDSVHSNLFEQGNLNAPICSDCHDPHSQPVTAKDAEGKPAYTEHAAIDNTCDDCHSGIYNQYRQSVHGEGVFVNKNPDVPSCTDCHGVHTIVDPTTAQFRLSSPNMCGDCHTDETIMGKYGLSTDVLSTYVADFHGTTVTLFQKQEPDQMVNMPVCYDCHGIHDIRRSDDPEYGLQIQDNLLVTCQKCHPDATANFPASWLSHYIPSKEKYPLVYYVELVYKILIPTVLGAMVLYVLTDIYRKVMNRRKVKPALVAEVVQQSQPQEAQVPPDVPETPETTEEKAKEE